MNMPYKMFILEVELIEWKSDRFKYRTFHMFMALMFFEEQTIHITFVKCLTGLTGYFALEL